MAVLLDTNVSLRLLQPHHPHYRWAQQAVTHLRRKNGAVCVAPQTLIEFWSVITRPIQENGLGLNTEAADAELDTLSRLFIVLPEVPLLGEWRRLVTTYRVSGKNTHDARLVAAMITHGIQDILTFNVQDFMRYSEIRIIDRRMAL